MIVSRQAATPTSGGPTASRSEITLAVAEDSVTGGELACGPIVRPCTEVVPAALVSVQAIAPAPLLPTPTARLGPEVVSTVSVSVVCSGVPSVAMKRALISCCSGESGLLHSTSDRFTALVATR